MRQLAACNFVTLATLRCCVVSWTLTAMSRSTLYATAESDSRYIALPTRSSAVLRRRTAARLALTRPRGRARAALSVQTISVQRLGRRQMRRQGPSAQTTRNARLQSHTAAATSTVWNARAATGSKQRHRGVRIHALTVCDYGWMTVVVNTPARALTSCE